MLYYISDDLVDRAYSGDKDIIDSLYSLGYFWRTGCCLVDGSRKSLLKLVNINLLADYYSLILDQKQNITGLYNEIDFFIVLCGNDSNEEKIINGAIGKSVSISKFSNRIKYGLNIVLCENIRDYDLYNWGAHYFSKISKDVFQINTLGYNGGGKMIVESARHISDYPSLVICDNDKKYPEDDEGSNLRELRKYFNQERPYASWIYPIRVHEIENLIPYSLLCLTHSQNGLIKKMKKVRQHTTYGSFFSFFDIKEGFKKCTLRKMSEENAVSFNVYVSFLLAIGVAQQKINKALGASYRKNDTPLLSGISGNILKDVVDYLESHELSQIVQDDYQKEDWKNIIRKIWSVGCASVPRRV